MAGTTITEAVVLRSFPFGEADRVLHLYTAASGRVGAMAKGVRRTKSRFGGRLEPFSHVELGLHRGRGELGTVTGASLVRSHDRIRSDGYRLQVGLVGLEAMLRLYTEEEQNDRAFLALTRFLDALDECEPQPGRRPAHDPIALSFQLKLLWLSGFLPHIGELRRVRIRAGPRRIRRRRGRCAVRVVRPRHARAVARGSPRPDGAPRLTDRGCLVARARRPRRPGHAGGRDVVVRAARRLPPPHARLNEAVATAPVDSRREED